MQESIPRHILFSAEIRNLETPEDKAAHIKYRCESLTLAQICRELEADYKKATRRLNALKEGRKWYGVGRPPLVDKEAVKNTEKIIEQGYKKGDAVDYEVIRKKFEDHYAKKLASMTSEASEKYPPTLRKNYVYEIGKKYEFNTKTPLPAEQNRNECSTTGTVHYFFENTFTREFCEGVPPELFLNADETSVEVGLPRKVILPPGAKDGRKVDKFAAASHITAMITINATGDDFTPYVIVPLKRAPKDVSTLVASGKITLGGSPNGWMDDECFENWAIWFVDCVFEIREAYGHDRTQRAILLLDGHGSRNNSKVAKIFKDAYIDVIIFPPHMTHIMQPFDRVIARPLKDCLARIARELIEEYSPEDQSSVPVLRKVQIMSIIDAHRVATTTRNCRVAFAECGIYPYDPNKILKNKQVKNSTKNFIQTDTIPGPGFKISGKCITSDDVISCLKERKSKSFLESPKTKK